MRTIIITINILLLSLILYNLLSRGDKLLENLENCDAENSKQNALTAKINVTEGDLLIFPAYLPHSVEENKSDEDRVIISFNIDVLR